MTTPFSTSPGNIDPAQAITQAIPSAMQLRIGRVISYDGTKISVSISGSPSLIDASYLVGQYQPALGDNVVCIMQDSQWLILGETSPMPKDNPVANASFELGALGAFPVSWGIWHDAASSTPGTTVPNVVTRETRGAGLIEMDGARCAELVFINGTLTDVYRDIFYSEPILVQPGQRWAASAWVAAMQYDTFSEFNGSTNLRLGFYSNTSQTPNNWVAEIFDSYISLPNGPDWVRVTSAANSSGVLVPDGAQYMRIHLYSITTGYGAIFYDRVTCARMS